MKILFFSNSIGGLKSFRFEFIEELIKKGNIVGICSPQEISPQLFLDLGCECFDLEMSRHGINPFSEYKAIKKLRRIIRLFNPDIVLSYTIKPNIYGSIICSKESIPIIASVTGLGGALDGSNKVTNNFIIWVLRQSLKNANHIFFQNLESLQFFNKKRIQLKSASLVAGSGVNLEKFNIQIYPREENGIHFLYIGRILEQKGIGQYLEAAKIIKSQNKNIYFHIIGIKDDYIFSNMVEEFHEKGYVIFHGAQVDVRPFIKMSHCLVHPTFYPEGMSNVLLESSAMGRPAITTDRSGCREIIDDEETGFIVGQQSIDELISALKKFIELPWTTKKLMGMRARVKVEKEFDRNIVIKDYINKIEELTHLKV